MLLLKQQQVVLQATQAQVQAILAVLTAQVHRTQALRTLVQAIQVQVTQVQTLHQTMILPEVLLQAAEKIIQAQGTCMLGVNVLGT